MSDSSRQSERAKESSPGSRPERGGAETIRQAADGHLTSEPNVASARSSPPSGKAAGGVSFARGPQRPEVVEYMHTLLQWAVPTVQKFPKSYRFTLGERIEKRLYEVLENLIRATYAARPTKQQQLGEANVSLEVLRHETRLAAGFGLLSKKQIEHVTRLTDEVGRRVGGWLRSLR